MFRCFIVLAFIIMGGAAAAQTIQVKPEDMISYFKCANQTCDLKCWGTGGNIDAKYKEMYVYQFKQHPTRLWLNVDGTRYVLGDNMTCKFGSQPTGITAPPPSEVQQASPPARFKPNQQEETCIGNNCY
jgi:hypothetical protein